MDIKINVRGIEFTVSDQDRSNNYKLPPDSDNVVVVSGRISDQEPNWYTVMENDLDMIASRLASIVDKQKDQERRLVDYAQDENNRQQMIEILQALGIKMTVHGCGCCGSPSVHFIYNNEEILDQDDCCFES